MQSNWRTFLLRFILAILALLLAVAYLLRRMLLARLLKLSSPRSGVRVLRNIPIGMPDGVRLMADHYAPKAEGSFPTVLIRTPYGRGKEVALFGGYPLSEMPARLLAERGYHVIVQGVRGCYDSGGVFSPHVNDGPDGQATLAWIARQPWFNGSLATWGPSYLGYTQWATAAGGTSLVKAMVPIVASAENFTVTHPDGAFGLETRLRWSQGMWTQRKLHGRSLREHLKQRLSGAAEKRLQAAFGHLPLREADTVAAGEPIPYFREILAHTDPNDPFWAARDHSGRVEQVGAAVHFIGGWYDYYLRGTLRDFAALSKRGKRPYLTIGPWHHAHPDVMLTGLREGVAWFDAHLKGQGQPRQKPVRLFVMSADEWQDFDAFPPPARSTPWYLQPGAALATQMAPAGAPRETYRYDPADPTPALGGALLGADGAGPQDNAPLEAREDVLCYTTPPLMEDVTVIGPVRLALWVRSSLAYTDFFGRLCDVDGNGRSTNVCDGLFRVGPGQGDRQPDGSLRIEIDMWATAYRFRQGHSLRLQVSSGAHPRWSRNLGLGGEAPDASNGVIAQQTIYHDAAHPSALILPLVEPGA